MLSQVRIVRRRGKAPLLQMRFARPARLSAAIRRRRAGGRLLRVRSRKMGGCRTYRVGLRYRHGRIAVRAAVGRVSERRTVRF